MKKSIKKVLAGVVACSMVSSAFTAMAASTVEVTNISVLEDNEVVATFAPTDENIRLTPEQMLEVTVKVTGDETDDVYASFLSNKSEGELSNSTVQYVGQKAVDETSTATFKFRPRETVGQGSFTAKSGATGATAAASFNYLVKDADKAMTLTGRTNNIKVNEDSDATFVIAPTGFTGDDYSGFSVYLDNKALSSDKYTIAKTENELILTVKHENFADKVSGEKVKVTVKHDSYTDAESEIVIADAVWNVTLNKNGGQLADGSSEVTSYTPGTAVALPILTKEHYTFDGWCEQENCSDTPIKAIPANATGNKTYYAKFTAETYTIILNADGGTFAETPVSSYTYGVGITLPIPTKEHYTFGGWYDNKDLEGTEVTEISATETGNKTYFAKWTKKNETQTLTVLDVFKDIVDVTKLVDTNTTITVTAKAEQTMPALKMYRAVYTADKVLKNVEEISANTLNGSTVFTFAPLTLGNGETSKVMLWSNNTPVINAITN